MPNYSSAVERVEYNLESVEEDRTVNVSLRDLLYAHQTIAEFVQFFHQPQHYPDLKAVEEFLGSRGDGEAIDVLSEALYVKFNRLLPADINEAFGEGHFDHPLPPAYYDPN